MKRAVFMGGICIADTHCGHRCRLRPYPTAAHCHSLPDVYTLSNPYADTAYPHTGAD